MNRLTLATAAFTIGMFLASATTHAQTTWYVDDDGDPANVCTSWADACPELQTALGLANSGDQIWVAEGTYKPDYDVGTEQHTGDREATFQLTNGVALYGGFPDGGGPWESRDPQGNEAILSGDLNGDDGPDFANNGENSYHVLRSSGTAETPVLDGFTIISGNANGGFPDYYGGGMYNTGGSPTVANCTFSGNSAELSGGGMSNRNNSSPTVTNCMFIGNGSRGGGMSNDNSSPILTNCAFSGNISAYSSGGMYNYNSDPTLINCTFSENSANGHQGGGMYNVFFSNPVLTNCSFTGNYAEIHGGGMSNWDNSSPELTNCTFIGNYAELNGGGMYNSTSSSPALANCTFSGNVANSRGGAMYNTHSTPTVTNCTLSGNSADLNGGGICNYSSNPIVTNCTFSGNTVTISGGGGGMYNYEASPTLTNCTFSGNSAGARGGGMSNWLNSSPTVTNCTFTGNSAEWGGGIRNTYSSPTVTNCTFSGNSASDGGGIYNANNSSPTVTNCILWGDTPDEIFVASGSPIVNFSDVEGGWPGEGNIDDDPLFVDPDGPDNDPNTWEDNDYHLSFASPCIDTGDPGFVPEPGETDMDGEPRVGDGDGNGVADVDMGADEYYDCNNNDIPDYKDIADGTSYDCQPNGIPDECEGGPWLYGDVNGSGEVDIEDLVCVLDGFMGRFSFPGVTFEDIDIFPCDGGNGDINLMDVFAILDTLAGQPACPDPCP